MLRGPFKGAPIFCKLRNSKRKLFGVYEHVLNEWIADVLPSKQFVFDVGANTGYETYGFAWLLKRSTFKKPCIVAFEPQLSEVEELRIPLQWPEYKDCDIQLVEKFVGAEDCGDTVTIDAALEKTKESCTGPGLFKIDIEGAEIDALRGATEALRNPQYDWLIEIHGRELITEVAQFFVKAKRPFLVREDAPVPILGKENRKMETFWLTTFKGE